MTYIQDEIEIWQDSTKADRVSCPKKFPNTNLKNQCHHFFSVAIDTILFKLAGIEDISFSYLQVRRTFIKALMYLNFGHIPPLTMELAVAALESIIIDVPVV